MTYPYDPEVLRRTAKLLYANLPAHYKVEDAKAKMSFPVREAELENFIRILAVPLAVVRQSVEELYGDFFVDSAGDDVLPLLAESIGLSLVFRDADANRRDIRGAVQRRRRKGTPAMLQALARELSDRLVSTQEGWKHIQLAQDLNLLRMSRVAPDLHGASVAERIDGPLEDIVKSCDVRPITANSGRIHPKHLSHWLFTSQFFPLQSASAHQLPDGDADLRFAFNAINEWRSLRSRSSGGGDELKSDRIPEMIFAERPGDWFGREGRFSVNIANLPAAASMEEVQLSARQSVLSIAVLTPTASIRLIDFDGRDASGAIDVELMAVSVVANLPDSTTAVRRAGINIEPSGVTTALGSVGAMPANIIPMLRISPAGAAVSRIFPSTVLAVMGGRVIAQRASEDAVLAEQGYLRGAVYVRIPAGRITDERWFYIAADGSLHEASTAGAGIDIPMEVVDTVQQIPPRVVASEPVGVVWPPAPSSIDLAPFSPAVAAPGAAPVPLHGFAALRPSGAIRLSNTATSAIVFALTYFALGQQFAPMLRLTWHGSDPADESLPSDARWQVVAQNGTISSGGSPIPLDERFADLAEVLAEGRPDVALAIRFESSVEGAILTPGEISFTGFYGRAVLVHLPELQADLTDPTHPWIRGRLPIRAYSEAIQVGRDGSTFLAGSNILRRRALGNAVPLRDFLPMRRRLVARRRLCPWRSETLVDKLDPIPPGRLDIDPAFGLFAIAATDELQNHPSGPTTRPPAVSVDWQIGYTMRMGALPIDHHRYLNEEPLTPTRIVSASGRLSKDTDPVFLGHTIHRTLQAAFDAIAVDPQPEEVVKIEDSAFYANEALSWPAGPNSLILLSASSERPIIDIASSMPGLARYDNLSFTGIALTSVLASVILPPTQNIALRLCSVLRQELQLEIDFSEQTGKERLQIDYCMLAGISTADAGEIIITDSVLDAGSNGSLVAIDAPLATLQMDRATVIGPANLERVDISDAIFLHDIIVGERFEGCVRYSRITSGSQVPRKHRVLIDLSVEFVTFDRHDPAHLRLMEIADSRILTGASNGGEMGAFNKAGLNELISAVRQRLSEHTPAGLTTGLIRIDT